MSKYSIISKRVIAAALGLAVTISLTSCSGNKPDNTQTTTAATTTTAAPTTTKPVNPNAINPLTGVQDLDKSAVDKRPVAIMINNIKPAQAVQTGVGNADMVFETLVEGGITRLMAVFSDVSKMGQIGTVRSARYTYAELAYGLDARYVHCGSDDDYNTPFMRDLGMDNLDLGYNASSAGVRISNGLAWEHTLYTYGDKLSAVANKGRTEIKDRAKDVYSFNDETSPVKYDNEATDVFVKFSSSYKSTFEYDTETKKYIRGNNGSTLKDYKTGKTEQFKNVIVIFTDVHELSDGKHMKSELTSGNGYYITEGTYTEIKWSKNGSSNPLKFTNTDGSELKLNAGNSYICITDNEYESVISFN
ncbi:MAG: DUF3048 domain-containing protein [Clostridia bacterium]|nr:DUF3048 domain-containing protein [Clostridia bacterium]